MLNNTIANLYTGIDFLSSLLLLPLILQQLMEDQDQYILQDDAVTVLSLFPKREATLLMPSLPTYSKLFESLTCTICRQIFSNPVYLKCSHRFCKECIEKYIRSNARKSCPNCRGGLTTKRDLRLDYNIESLIAFAFGDARKMSKQLEEIEKVELKQMEKEKGEMKRVESMSDLRGKKGQGYEEPNNISVLKRVKTTDGQETKKRKRQPSEKKIKPGQDPEKDSTPARKTKQFLEKGVNLKKEEPQGNIEVRQKKKRSHVVIEIQSSDPVQVQEIPPQQFFNAQDNTDNNKINSLLCSISMIPEVSEIESAKKIASMRDVEAGRPQPEPEGSAAKESEMVPQVQQPSPEKEQTQMIDEAQTTIPPQVLSARECLKQQFGGNFLNKIIELTDYPIFMRLSLRKHPAHPFTPSPSFQNIKIPAKATAHSVLLLLSQQLTINPQAIKLFVCQDLQNNYIQVVSGTKMQEINNRFWRSFGGFQILQLGEEGRQQAGVGWQNRILYFAVDYSKIVV